MLSFLESLKQTVLFQLHIELKGEKIYAYIITNILSSLQTYQFVIFKDSIHCGIAIKQLVKSGEDPTS